MHELRKLNRFDIEINYKDKPILVEVNNNKTWYIVIEVYDTLPLHMLSSEECELYEKDKSIIEGIKVCGKMSEMEDYIGYLLWKDFGIEDGWSAYGYE